MYPKMAASVTTHNLKIYAEHVPNAVDPAVSELGKVCELFQSFAAATGWSLRYLPGTFSGKTSDRLWSVPVERDGAIAPGHLVAERIAADLADLSGPTPRAVVEPLVCSIARLLAESLHLRHVLWLREAELAAGVPMVPAADEEKHLAARLESVLKGGAKAVGCQAAALFLLDEATTQLKLRSTWGLPLERLLAPARPLRGAIADLEALLGHAVVLDDPATIAHWRLPEEFPSAACVPVSTPTTLLGTVWFFSTKQRSFNDRQTNILEVVAGRIAADLEREVLLREGIQGGRLKRVVAAAERFQQDHSPAVPPQIPGWDIAGWTAQAQGLGGDFHDWFCPSSHSVATVLGSASGTAIEGAIAAAAARTAMRCFGQQSSLPHRVLHESNQTLWSSCAGTQGVAAYCGLIDLRDGRVCYSTAGQIGLVVARSDASETGHIEVLAEDTPRLGEKPETEYAPRDFTLQPGETVAVVSEGVLLAADAQGRPFGIEGVTRVLSQQAGKTAAQVSAALRNQLEKHTAESGRSDWAAMVLRRTLP